MSDSEDFNSAKDEDFDEPAEAGSSEDEPLSKSKKSVEKKSKAASKTPKKNGKSPKKAGRPPGKPGRKSSPKKAIASPKDGKRGRGRPPASASKKAEKPAKVSSPGGDPLALSDVDPLDNDADDEVEEYEVEAIVGHREYDGQLRYKIRWKNYDPKHDTWEDYGSLCCPDLLESYNFKNKITIPKYISKKRKAGAKRGRKPKAKKTKTSRRSSISDEESEEQSVGESELCDDGEGDEYEVDKIVDVRNKKDGTREFKVHWKRWSSNYDTWEPEENLSCAELIEKFLNKVEEAKNSNVKELRADRKHTERFTLSTHEAGRRLSKRNNQKQRVRYDGADSDDED